MSEPTVAFEVDGQAVEVPDDGASLLGTLRDRLGNRSAKDGCSPQGQCGCCTVLVDGQPRVACVTPTRRVEGRSVTTVDGLAEEDRLRWGRAFCSAGASQCGFCTPGIIVRLAGLEAKKPDATPDEVRRSLAAHLCRCTGWQTIGEAWDLRNEPASEDPSNQASATRASIEGGSSQRIDVGVALGGGGFADDVAPLDALVAVRRADGEWVVGETLHHARTMAGKIQGRRTTLEPHHPLAVPGGAWDATLRTTWTEPGYLETDAAWAQPGETAHTPLANGGAFGAKTASPVAAIAEDLARQHGKPVRVLMSREDTVHLGPKRPPVAGGATADGRGVLRVVATAGIDQVLAHVAPELVIEQVEVGDRLNTSAKLRAAIWLEAWCLVSMARGEATRLVLPSGGWAEASVDDDGIDVLVGAGQPLDPTVLRSYAIGAAHMATSLVCSEALAVDAEGVVQDLTTRSFGILSAQQMPSVTVTIAEESGEPTNGSDAVFAAVAAATSVHLQATEWPCGPARK